MKLTSKHQIYEYEVEVTQGVYETVVLTVSFEGERGYAVLSQVDALSLARIIEEQVKEIRRMG